MPTLKLTNNGTAKQIQLNGFAVAEVSETKFTLLKALKILAPTADDEPVRRDQAFGVAQTSQDVTASRNFDVLYTNTTGKPIVVRVRGLSTAVGAYILGQIGSLAAADVVSLSQVSSTSYNPAVEFIVAPGESYGVQGTNVSGVKWREIR